MGRPIEASGAIVIRSDQMKVMNEQDEDPIYGNALPRTWEWLNSISDNGLVDMGVLAISKKLDALNEDKEGTLSMLSAPAPDAPVIIPSYLDCWVQTWPEPSPDPDVSAFLHGPERGLADIDVCWRADLDGEKPDERTWTGTVSLSPPTPPELMPVPLSVFRRWLAGIESSDSELTDVEGAATSSEEIEPERKLQGLIWNGPEDSFITDDPGKIRPGDIVVLPASSRGWETLGHVPGIIDDDARIDRADESRLLLGYPPLLRLHPALVQSWPASPSKKEISELDSAPPILRKRWESRNSRMRS